MEVAAARAGTPRYLAGGIDAAKTTPYATGDPRAPRSVYGQSKADAEVQLGQILPECCIVCTSWLFGTGGKCFPDTILKLAASRPELEVVSDQRGSPTYVVDLARAIIQLCRKGAGGIVHATNHGECSWYEFAREIIAIAGLDTVVRETTSDKFVRPAQRPKYSVLSPESLQKYGVAMPDWRDALRQRKMNGLVAPCIRHAQNHSSRAHNVVHVTAISCNVDAVVVGSFPEIKILKGLAGLIDEQRGLQRHQAQETRPVYVRQH